ncbi:uncharacterized protein LOC118441034 isoform X1 [Vespa mandarinia]|uniref:uncharacterized protein LOC118441034 isoform X1 n=2 Tax=Vespa mandarinia TaxID=7446 RepID=UPI0016131B9D|nr:uncharacterized protein LOC118441034 isoform X1 [Vespa mandarinia]
MEKSLKLIIHRSQIIFDNVSITWNSAIKYLHQNNEKGVKSKPNILDNKLHYKIIAVPLNQRGFNAYLVSLYVNSLIKSNTYRKTAIQVLLEHLSSMTHQPNSKYIILIKLRTPKKQFLDYKWNERITKIILETRELDYAMSWLSTLGGAFSALGEEFQHCAQMAGKISIKQFQLALHLGNPLLVARCKLYAALSLIQQGYFKTPKHMIKNIYKLAVDQNDTRLQNMYHFLKGLLPSLSKSTHWIPCW